MANEATWNDDVLRFKSAGFSDEEIAQEQDRVRLGMEQGGFRPEEINSYFGQPEPDMSGMKGRISENFKKWQIPMSLSGGESQAQSSLPGSTPTSALAPPLPKVEGETGKKEPEKAKTFLDAVEAGLEMSVAGLAIHGAPDTVMPEDADMFMNIAYQLGSLVPDLPIMGIGGAIGGIAGGAAANAVAPVVGTPAGVTLGTGAGAFALPTALRTALMEHYEKGDIKDFRDFWERTSAVFIESAKSAVVGAATAGVGGAVGKAVKGVASPLVKTSATLSSEIATMVTVGKALEGQVPKWQDFTEAALLVGALHGVAPMAKKMRDIYSKTGVRPEQVVEHAERDATVKQDLLSENKEIPDAYKNMEEAPRSVDGVLVPEKIDVTGTESALVKNGPEFSPEFSADKIEVQSEPPREIIPYEKPAAEGASSLDQARDKIRSKLGDAQAEKTESWSGLKEKAKETFDGFYTNYLDKFDPIKRAVKELASGESLGAASDPYKLARMANDANSKTKVFIERGTFDYNDPAKTTGKSLKEILKPLGDNVPDFELYLTSKRALEYERRGLESGFDTDAAREIVKADSPRFEKAAKEIVQFQNSVSKYLMDSGFITKERYEAMLEQNKDYVPFRRISEASNGEAKTSNRSKKNPIKELKGVSDELTRTANPLESIVENTQFLIELAEKNRAAKALVDLAGKSKDQDLIRRKGGNEGAVTEFTGKKAPTLDSEFEVFINGKREVFETTPEIAQAVKAMDGEPAATNILFKIAKGASSALRMSLSVTPDFIMRNFFRDQLTQKAFSENGTSVVDTVGALRELMGKEKGDVYWNWLKSGGSGGAFLDFNREYLSKDIYNLSKETGMMDTVFNVVKNPLDMANVAEAIKMPFKKTLEGLHFAGSLAEQATRLAEFTKSTKGDYSPNSLFQGGFNSREITVDFQRMGAKMSALNAITAFQNVAVQGLDRSVRAVKENPKGTLKQAGTWITAPSVLLWYANKDDKRYQDLPRWQKDMFWIIPTDDWVKPDVNDNIEAYRTQGLLRFDKSGVPEINKGVVYRLPKPQELGLLFGSLPERVLEKFFTDNPNAMKDFEGTIAEALTPALIPNIITAPIETWANKSFFTGAPIVPSAAEKLLPEYRYNDYTSETAKKISSLIAQVPGMKQNDLIAPAVIENWITSWSGNLGKYALQAADKGLVSAGIVEDQVKPESTLADIPFVKAFIVRNPSSNMQPILDFREKFKENQQVLDTIKSLTKQGDFKSAQREYFLAENQDKLISLKGANESINRLNQTIRMIYANPNIKPHEKRQQIDGMYYMMNEIAKQQNKVMDQMGEVMRKNNLANGQK